MENISLQSKANFFESRVSSYQKSGVMESLNNTNQNTEDIMDDLDNEDF